MPLRDILILIILSLTLGAGCSSKWALADQDYREKYNQPYPKKKHEKWVRMSKQVIDARHLRDQGGLYTKGGWSENPDAGLGEIGVYGYSSPSTSWHLGASALVGEERILGLPGLELGVRAQTPSRLAPFVGVGTYVNLLDVAIRGLLQDDDDCGCPEDDFDPHSVFATFYPEVGVHYWLTPGLRVTGSAAYHLSSRGRDNDFLLLGVSFSHMEHTERVVDEHIGTEAVNPSDRNHVELTYRQTSTCEELFEQALEATRPPEKSNDFIPAPIDAESEEASPFCFE